MNRWNRILKIRIRKIASSKWSILLLILFAFADASFFPLPVTTYFLLLIFIDKERSNLYVFNAVIGTLCGAIAGYLTGRFAFLSITGDFSDLAQFLFSNIPGFSESLYYKTQVLFSKWNFWILCGASITPIPYAVFSVFSGVFEINILIFLFATIICQTVKYYFIAFATLNLGNQIKKLRMANLKPFTIFTSAITGVIFFISNLFKNLFQIN